MTDKKLFGQGRTVHIIAGNSQYHHMFESVGFIPIDNLKGADVVCFTGGEDVDPSVYHEQPLMNTYFNARRDVMEIAMFKAAKQFGKFMVGICRGGQFLNVMNGGRLWQDVNNHTRYHHMQDVITGKAVWVSSTHHQMMRPASSGLVLAVANEATKKNAYNEVWRQGLPYPDDRYDTEVVWYKDTKSLCFQPHPEYDKVDECREYFFDCLKGCMEIAS